eukprot:15365724-Ditylum_brightwellii.AAC.1
MLLQESNKVNRERRLVKLCVNLDFDRDTCMLPVDSVNPRANQGTFLKIKVLLNKKPLGLASIKDGLNRSSSLWEILNDFMKSRPQIAAYNHRDIVKLKLHNELLEDMLSYTLVELKDDTCLDLMKVLKEYLNEKT